jgi:hypothetical protein
MRKGEIEKQHYEDEKLGSCALLAAIEPLTGQRFGQVHERRTKREFMLFCQALATAYPEATNIRLVLDNLNTHNASSFYEHLSAEEAFALSRQCLDRRIATIEELSREVLALLQERSRKAIKIHWQFSIQAARTKLNSHSTRVNSAQRAISEFLMDRVLRNSREG